MKLVTLYENNAGGLYLHMTGDDKVYGQIEQASEPGQFVADCKSLLAGEGSDWEVETYPLSEIEDVPEVGQYDGSVCTVGSPGLVACVYMGIPRD